MVKNILLLIVFFLTVSHSFSQQTTTIQILNSELLIGTGQEGVVRVIKPVFLHEGSTLAADSSTWNRQLNTFDAFGHIVITQTDGTTIRSELLNYNGNTRIAVLTNNVRMLDKDGTLLTTDHFTYNMGTKIGSYTNGGKIVNKEDILTSKNGWYFENSKDAYFRYNVMITTKEVIVKADTMRYNTGSKIAYFFGPTYIYGKKDTVYTELGDYNTTTRQANGFKNNLYSQGSKTLRGDTIFYDDKNGTGKVNNNITFNDTHEKITMKGDLGVYSRVDSSTTVTKNAYLIMAMQDSSKTDSLWLAADTLQTRLLPMNEFKQVKIPRLKKDFELKDVDEIAVSDSTKLKNTTKIKADLKKSGNISEPQDTSKRRVIFAYHHVKIFKSDLQALTDSVSYSYVDSIIRCYKNPMLWSQGSQLSADTIFMQLKNRKLDNMVLQHNGFIVSVEDDSAKYDQIKGRILTGIFKDDKLSQLFIDGNAESIKYVKEETDTSYTGMNKTVSSRIKMDFANSKLVKINFIGKADGDFIPIDKIPEDLKILQGFIWKPKDRPKSPEDIIPSFKKSSKIDVPTKSQKDVKPAAKTKK
jgi:lipopolysaccharide export system protein LptA